MKEFNKYDVLVSTENNTVVAEYKESEKEAKFMLEREIEQNLINILSNQGYEWIKINDEKELKSNLRRQIEKLNNLQENHKDKEFKFTDQEWTTFFKEHISNNNIGLEEKTENIQSDFVKILKRDDGTTKNIYLIDKKHIHNNYLQVINQYSEFKGNHNCRYDVTILVNGFPLVHIELKRNNIDIREAFRQIDRYQENSFWAGGGLFEYVQIFIISNGQDTRYYSNTTRDARVAESNKEKKNNSSFKFANYWTSKDHKKIKILEDFAKHFLNKKTILNILTKYCVFTSEKKLIVMRPYQIDAVESIVGSIQKGIENKKEKSGGCIWHATGSGKTLTSFKASELASKIPEVKKVLFVVDRKSLDHQTTREYEKYGGDLTTDTASTFKLLKELQDLTSDQKIIVTSIQKLSKICNNKERNLPIFNENVVLIFDECHRSQFGEMHKAIINKFKKRHIFGFTGTPIFEKNSDNHLDKTTENLFGKIFPNPYTLVHAIGDGNVLKFQVSFLNVKVPERINAIVDYVIEHFNAKTHNNQWQKGFNSMLASNSIDDAIQYYKTFKEKLGKRDLKLAAIFSPEDKHNEELEKIMQDYNKTFGTDYDLSKYDGYRSHVSKGVKDRKIDLLVVADMFLTGFDAPCLNTLWLDKPTIRDHNLIQAFSRTNRIYNEIKSTGIIVSFNNIQKQMDEALELFGYEKEDRKFIIDKTFEEQYLIYEKHIENLKNNFPLDKANFTQEQKKAFLEAWNDIEPQISKLSNFDEFKNNELLTEDDSQKYRQQYLDYADEFKKKRNARTEKNETIIEEPMPSLSAIEFIKQVDVDIYYILDLIEKQEDREKIERIIKSSPEYRDKWPLFREYMDNKGSGNNEDWRPFIEAKILEEVENLINEWKLRNSEEVHRIVNEKNLEKVNKGEWIENVLPVMSYSDPNKFRTKQDVRDRLRKIIIKYLKIF